MTSINEALDTIRALNGQRVGNGQCYGLVSYFESLITPDSTVGLGAGVGAVSGAVGNTINASDIGTAYDWLANGWSVVYPNQASDFRPGGIINIKAFQPLPFDTGEYGHTAVITAVNGKNITLHEQNALGREYVVEQVYTLNDVFISQIASIVYPPNSGAVSQSAAGKLKDERGTMTVTVDILNVRDMTSLSGNIVAEYHAGDKFNYDSVYIGEGYIWVSYIGASSGQRRYAAAGKEKGGRNSEPFGTFK